MNTFPPGSTIGMLGGGQLGRMSGVMARQMGYRLITLDPTPDGPCGQLADDQIVAAYDDLAAITALGRRCEVVTYEFENVALAAVHTVNDLGKPVYPGAKALGTTQNRLAEKTFVREIGLNVVDFMAISSAGDVETAAEQIGFPAILKTVSGGYDGKGQVVVQSLTEAQEVWRQTDRVTLIWEKMAPFVKELSIICARNQAGEVVAYPATENIHVDNILDISIAPARVSPAVQQEAQRIAAHIASELELVGVCGIELFLLPDDTLLVNEMAPRPHNSGHHTIESCHCSQFEQHIRAICGLPLGDASLKSPAVMVNILGEGQGNTLHGLDAALADSRVHFHLYGKNEAKAKRKMGHITVLDDDVEAALATALEARRKIRWG